MPDAKPASSRFQKIATIVVAVALLVVISSAIYGFIRGAMQPKIPMVPGGRPGEM